MRIIGISGRAGHGKDTCASFLPSTFVRLAFADPLKDGVAVMFGFTHEQVRGSLKEQIDPRYGVSPRQCMQWLGTEFGRKLIADNVWVRVMRSRLDDAKARGTPGAIITDVRFPNEADAIREWGGEVWRVVRTPAPPAVNPHPSETALDGYAFDRVVENVGTLEDLRNRVIAAFDGLAAARTLTVAETGSVSNT